MLRRSALRAPFQLLAIDLLTAVSIALMAHQPGRGTSARPGPQRGTVARRCRDDPGREPDARPVSSRLSCGDDIDGATRVA